MPEATCGEGFPRTHRTEQQFQLGKYRFVQPRLSDLQQLQSGWRSLTVSLTMRIGGFDPMVVHMHRACNPTLKAV